MPVRVRPMSSLTNNNSGPKFIKTLFKYTRILFLAGGIYPGNGIVTQVSQQISRLKKIFVGVVVLIFLTQSSLFCYVIYSRAKESKEYTRLLIFFIVLTSNIFQSIFSSAMLPKALANLEKEMIVYNEKYRCKTGTYLTSQRVAVVSVTSTLGTLLLVPLFLLYIQTADNIMCDIFPVCNVEGFLKYPLFLFNAMIFLITTFQWEGFWLIAVFFSLNILQEFKGVNELFKTVNPSIDSEGIDSAITHHEAVVKILARTNECVQHYGFFGLFHSLPVNCIFLYTLFSEPSTTQDITILFFAIGSALAHNLMRLFLEARVSSEAHGPLQYVWKLRKCNLSKEQFRNFELFIHRLTGDTIGYSLYGLVTINMSTLLGIVGTLATYFIVALQFQTVSTVCSEIFTNITYCVTSA